MKNHRVVMVIIFVVLLCSASFGAERVYEEGTVWNIGMIKTEANMQEEYIKNLAGAWKKVMDEAQAQGLILSYKIMVGNAANPDDWDVLLLTEFENYAAMEGKDDQWDAITEKVVGTEEEQIGKNIERGKIREVFGGKLMREITIK